MKLPIATMLLGVLGCVTPCLAQTAGWLSFQGLIKDDQGELITGTVTLQFRIYDAELDGALVDMNGDGSVDEVVGLDVKEVPGVNVTQGILTTKFGPVSPKAFNGDDRWLEVSVDGDPLSRIEMATAPATAEQLNRPASGEAAAIVDDAGNVGIGVATPSTRLDVDGAMSGFGIVPIGSIIAWHKTFKGTPGLPSGWLECDGVTVIPDGPLAGQTMPDLNPTGKFLRGSVSSGFPQQDAFKSHSHFPTVEQTFVVATEGGNEAGISNPGTQRFRLAGSTGLTGGSETRPINMSVVWIMRVK